jgi:3-deoxy-D-manno-octulosonate 8-phosphate phosphatase (KDO 8-P phosphatase)
MQTLYGELAAELVNKFAQIKLLICDVDGVFSDGRIYLGNQGEELKAFHTRDGHGIKTLVAKGISFAVITGRSSQIVSTRMTELGARYIYQGQKDKTQALAEIQQQLNLQSEEIAYIGDDMPDYHCMKNVGLSIAVNDAHPSIVNICDYHTCLPGGFGAVREACDLILTTQGFANE